MKIKNITLYKVEIPMITAFTTSFGTTTRKPTVIVRVQMDDGIVGYGEASAMMQPLYKPETVDICMLALRDYLTPLVINKQFETIEEMMVSLKPIKGQYFSKTGLETACFMVESLKKNQPLAALLGGTRKKIGVGESLGIKSSIEETLEEVQLRLDQGFQRIKIKIKPGWDIKVVNAIREKFGDIDLMVDGNSAYSLSDIKTFKEMDDFALTMIEQPLADDDIVDHSVLQKEITTPICLDESIHSAEDARRAIFIGACKIINIKPGRVGGLIESKKIHDLCKKHNIGVWCGGLLESGIGRAFNIAIASLPDYIYPADMSPVNFFYKDDLVSDSFRVDKEGYISVPIKPGLGFTLDEKRLKKYTVEKIELT